MADDRPKCFETSDGDDDDNEDKDDADDNEDDAVIADD